MFTTSRAYTALALLAAAGTAQAVPSFARQTGSECAACHIGAYGLNLTPYGIRFKMGGYTDSDGKGTKVPLALQTIYQQVNPEVGKTERRLSEVDAYIAGRLAGQLGAFARVATRDDGTEHRTTLESVDVRLAGETKIGEKDAVLGLSLNNTPAAQDPFSVLPGRGFGVPTTDGTLLNSSSASPLANRVLGLSGYAFYDNNWYGEVGTYRTLSPSVQDKLGFESSDPGRLGSSSYWRLAYMQDWKTQFFSGGLVAFDTRRQRVRGGPADEIRDLGFDLNYQYLGTREHMFQARYAHIFERRRYGSTPPSPFVPGLVGLPDGRAQDRTLVLTYAFRQTYGLTLARLKGTGSTDAMRFPPYGRSDTTSTLVDLSWVPFGKEDSWATPWANVRLSASWFRFSKFNGSRTDVFGSAFGAPLVDAKDLDSFTLAARFAF